MDRELLHTSSGLSQAGDRRREAMLADLQRVVIARGRRRIAVRIALAGAGLACLVLAAAVALRLAAPVAPAVVPPRIADRPAPFVPDAAPAVSTTAIGASTTLATSDRPEWSAVPRIRTTGATLIRPAAGDGTTLDRARYRGVATIASATDETLAHALRASGKDAGVARTPGGVIVLPDRPAPDRPAVEG